MSENPRIGIVGLGRMGANMARRLKDCDYVIGSVFDRDRTRAITLAAELDTVASAELADLTASSDIIFTVVTDDSAMRSIFSATGDSLVTDSRGKTFINCATVTPSLHIELETVLDQHGATSLEACMASSIPQAREGSLYLMIAGRRAVFERVKPVLDVLATSLRYVGEAGRAAQLKALVNMVMNINTAGLAEGLGVAEALGLDLTLVREVFSQTGAHSRVLETDGADMQAREHDVYFSAEHAAKDSGIALALAGDVGLNTPVALAAFTQFELMRKLGLGDIDKSGVSELTFASRHPQALKNA